MKGTKILSQKNDIMALLMKTMTLNLVDNESCSINCYGKMFGHRFNDGLTNIHQHIHITAQQLKTVFELTFLCTIVEME